MCLLLKNLETVQIYASTRACNLYGMYKIWRVANLHKLYLRIFFLTLNPTGPKWDQLGQVALEASRILK